MDKSYFTKIFRKYFGESPNRYINNQKLDFCAKELILNEKITIEEISLNYGFSDYRYFTRKFKERYGEPPRQYRKFYRGRIN